MECRLELCLPDHPPALLCILIDRQNHVAQSWYRVIVSHPKCAIKTFLALIQHGEKGNVCSHLSDKLNGQPTPRSTTHVGLSCQLRKRTAEAKAFISWMFWLASKATSCYQIRLRIPVHERLLATDVYNASHNAPSGPIISQSLSGCDWSSERSSIHGAGWERGTWI